MAARFTLCLGWCWVSVTGINALWARVQGAQLPCAGQGRQPLPSRVDACVGSYWVLPDAEIGRAGSKAAFLPKRSLGENERKCLVPCGQRGQAFPVREALERKGEIAIE